MTIDKNKAHIITPSLGYNSLFHLFIFLYLYIKKEY